MAFVEFYGTDRAGLYEFIESPAGHTVATVVFFSSPPSGLPPA
jgi:hypothetical protein